jgi:hypothetical protein
VNSAEGGAHDRRCNRLSRTEVRCVMRKTLMLGWIGLGLGLVSCVGHAQTPGQSYALSLQLANQQRMAVDERQKKLEADAAQLLAMAQTLKSKVDATKKDELSLQVIRQADEIEKLAKSVKDRMRQ